MTSAPALTPHTPEEALEAVRSHARVLPVGAGTKPAACWVPPGCVPVSSAGLSGIIEYDPAEYTFTAGAGTPIREVAAELARHGQYLPFDPPLAGAGATLGGTIAAGLSGPGRQRYGGVRDFLLAVRLVTGDGKLIRGGGKVVKNAAGFDLPKLMVGSLGRLGFLVEATFKVFPRPRAYATLAADLGSLPAALAAVGRLASAPFDFEGLEFDPLGTVWMRLGGEAGSLAARLDALERFVGVEGQRMQGAVEDEGDFWRRRSLPAPEATELLVKIPTTLAAIPVLDARLAAARAVRQYGTGGSVAWVRWPDSAEELDMMLKEAGLRGLVLRGAEGRPLLGAIRGEAFLRRLKGALDPVGRFPEF